MLGGVWAQRRAEETTDDKRGGGRESATMEKLERTLFRPRSPSSATELCDEVKSSFRALNDDKNMLLKLWATFDQLREERRTELAFELRRAMR